MKTPTEIADLLIKDQESHEAIVRALHYNVDEFVEWSWGNTKYVAYSLGSLGIKLPVCWLEEDKPVISAKDMAVDLYFRIDEVREEILQQFNSKFNVSPNN